MTRTANMKFSDWKMSSTLRRGLNPATPTLTLIKMGFKDVKTWSPVGIVGVLSYLYDFTIL